MKVGLIVLATSKYIDFIPDLYESYKKYFLADCETKMFLFTDSEFDKPDVQVIKIEHKPWPMITANKFKYIVENDFDVEYIFCFDADNIFVDHFTKGAVGDLVGVLHGSFITEKKKATFENNSKSTAYLKDGIDYYTGSVWGGKVSEVKKMCKVLAENTVIDRANNIDAVWQDESHLNWYLHNNTPTLQLGAAYNYCNLYHDKYPGVSPIIECLTKDNEVYQV